MIALEDFFPGGVVAFVKPPFDERFWAHFGIPARCQPSKWGASCQRGFVSDERFARPGDQVIKRTNRAVTRAWRASGGER